MPVALPALELGQIPVHMLRAHLVEGAVEAALEQRERAPLQGICGSARLGIHLLPGFVLHGLVLAIHASLINLGFFRN